MAGMTDLALVLVLGWHFDRAPPRWLLNFVRQSSGQLIAAQTTTRSTRLSGDRARLLLIASGARKRERERGGVKVVSSLKCKTVTRLQ